MTMRLEGYVKDLSKAAREGKVEPAYGAEKKYFTLLQTLLRKNRRSVLVVGESGAGKTQFVRGLAAKALAGAHSNPPIGFTVLELDVPSLAATGLEAEENMVRLVKFLRESSDTVLVVEDLCDVLLGTSDNRMSVEAAKILASPILNGDIVCVGTTTPDALNELVASNSGLVEGFERIVLEPITERDTVDLLIQMRRQLEQHHGVPISETAVTAAIALSKRFVPEKRLPGKAVDALDQAAARYKMKSVAKDQFPDFLDEASMKQLRGAVGPYDVMRALSESTGTDIDKAVRERKEALAKALLAVIPGQTDAVVRLSNAVVEGEMGCGRPYGPLAVVLLWGDNAARRVQAVDTITGFLGGDGGRRADIDLSALTTESDIIEALKKIAPDHAEPWSAVLQNGEGGTPDAYQALRPLWEKGSSAEAPHGHPAFQHCLFLVSYEFTPSGESSDAKEQLGNDLRSKMDGAMLRLFDRVVRIA